MDLGGGPSLEWTVTKLILKKGGTMNLDGSRVTCSFPSGALPIPKLLVIAKMKLNGPRGSATRLDIDFQPSIVFERPVVLKVDSSYLTGVGNTYTLWYFDPVQNRWLKEMEQSYTAGLPVLFQISHYSAYAITR
jgi:hypothetical protein